MSVITRIDVKSGLYGAAVVSTFTSESGFFPPFKDMHIKGNWLIKTNNSAYVPDVLILRPLVDGVSSGTPAKLTKTKWFRR